MNILAAEVASLDKLLAADLDGSPSAPQRLEVQLQRLARAVHGTARGHATLGHQLPARPGARTRIIRSLLARHGVVLDYDRTIGWQLTAQPPHRPTARAVELNA